MGGGLLLSQSRGKFTQRTGAKQQSLQPTSAAGRRMEQRTTNSEIRCAWLKRRRDENRELRVPGRAPSG